MTRTKTFAAIGDNNFWYALGPKRYCESQAKKALKGKGDFEDHNLPEVEEVMIYEVQEVNRLYKEEKN